MSTRAQILGGLIVGATIAAGCFQEMAISSRKCIEVHGC